MSSRDIVLPVPELNNAYCERVTLISVYGGQPLGLARSLLSFSKEFVESPSFGPVSFILHD